MENIYLSLDEARAELRRRWQDEGLKEGVKKKLGENFMTVFEHSPKAISWKAVLSPDNSFTFFQLCSSYLGVEPIFFEHLGDKFTSVNEEKKNLGRLFLKENDKEVIYDICNIRENENKPVSEVILRNGEKLVNFYNTLFDFSGYQCTKVDVTPWAQELGSAADYYYKYLLHFVCHGVAFELFPTEDNFQNEIDFSSTIIIPTINAIKEEFGIAPMLVKPFPSDQSKEEDFFWWSYQPLLNNYLLKLCKDNNFQIKK